MIRRATLDDLDFVVKLGCKFYEISPWRGAVAFNEDDLRDFLTTLITGTGVIFIDDNSMCGGMLTPLYFNHSAKVAAELFWYSDGKGTEVREAFEDWAIDAGANLVQMTCLANEREGAMRRLYGRQGYDAKEVSLFRVI